MDFLKHAEFFLSVEPGSKRPRRPPAWVRWHEPLPLTHLLVHSPLRLPYTSPFSSTTRGTPAPVRWAPTCRPSPISTRPTSIQTEPLPTRRSFPGGEGVKYVLGKENSLCSCIHKKMTIGGIVLASPKPFVSTLHDLIWPLLSWPAYHTQLWAMVSGSLKGKFQNWNLAGVDLRIRQGIEGRTVGNGSRSSRVLVRLF